MQLASVAIIGAGPAGLTAAYDLVRHGIRPVVYEHSNHVGGIARTESYKGYRFDIGGHRFFTYVPEIQELWREILGDEFLKVSRLSRIHYRGKFFKYPLALGNTLGNLGLLESARIGASYLKARIFPGGKDESFEHWVVARFGRRLFEMFFKSYTEKVWGIPCREIRADWAAQRIRNLTLTSAVANALFGARRGVKSLIDEFHYPRLGPGQMWEGFRDAVEARGGLVHLGAPVVEIHLRGLHVTSLTVRDGERVRDVPIEHVISSMPLGRLIEILEPHAPPDVRQAARDLKYRDFLIVPLIVDRAEVFPDNWIYIHTPEVRVGRIQNFKNWSRDMVPDPAKTCLGMEYFCSRGDDLWDRDDAELIRLATRELDTLGLASAADVEDGCVIRQLKAYPVYDTGYLEHLGVIRAYLEEFDNLQVIGRNGMHRYNNQDHSMLCGLYASANLRGAHHDLWSVNTERSYYEEQRIDRRPRPGARRQAADARRAVEASGRRPAPPLFPSARGRPS
jgi:protoporphyrinogen oxidase